MRWECAELALVATGDVKLLKNRKTGKIRLLMRREKTLKIVANHLVKDDGEGTFNLKEHPSSDRSWTYTAQDFSEGETKLTTFAIRFANADSKPSCPHPARAARQLRVPRLTGRRLLHRREHLQSEVRRMPSRAEGRRWSCGGGG